jgi:hypothetical protein
LETVELWIAILLTGASAGALTYLTHEFENWPRYAIGINSTIALLFICKDLWSWIRYESGNFEAFLDMLQTGNTPSTILGMAALKVALYSIGLTMGALYMHREYRF